MEGKFNSFKWQNLLDDIQDQRCVLFLGPDVVQLNGLPLSKVIRNYVQQACEEGEIVQDYARDGLFLFEDEGAKTSARRHLSRFYKNQAIDETIFRQILD